MKRPDRLIHRHQGRGTIHVDGHCGALGAQDLGQARGGKTARGPGVVDRDPGRTHQFAVFRVADAHIDAGRAALQRLGGDPCILQGMPADLKQHALLWIEGTCLNGRSAEEGGVKTVEVPHKRAPERCGVSGRGALAGHRSILLDGRSSGLKQRPELLETIRVRESASHAHDSDGHRRVRVCRRHRHRGFRGDGRLLHGLGDRCGFATQFPGKEPGHGPHVRMVEHDGARCLVAVAEGAVDSVSKLDGHQRVNSQVRERGFGIGRRRQAKQRLQFLLQQSHKGGLPPLRFPGPEMPQDIGGAFLCLRRRELRLATGNHVRKERLFTFKPVGVGRPVDRSHNGRRAALRHHPVQCGNALTGGHPTNSGRHQMGGNAFPLFLRFADFGPGTPMDDLRRQAAGPPVRRQALKKRVGRRVIALPGPAKDTDAAREEDEQMQIAWCGRPVQVPSTQDLGPEHGLKGAPVLILQRTVGKGAHAVDDPAQGRHGIVNAVQHRCHRGRVRNVGQFNTDINPAGTQRSDIRLRLGSGRAAAVEDNRPRTFVSQPLGGRAPDAPKATCDQIGPVLPQTPLAHRRHRQDDLADVSGRLHVLHGARRVRQIPHTVLRHIEDAGIHVGHGGAQHIAQIGGNLVGQPVDVKHGVGDVRAHAGHLVAGPGVAHADLDKAPSAGKTRQGRFNETGAGKTVQDEIHTGPAGVGHHLLGEMGIPAVVNVLHPHGAHMGPLRRAAGCKHLCPGRTRQLHGGRSDTTRRSVNQDPAAGAESRVPECQPGRGVDNRHPRHPCRRQPVRQLGEQCSGSHNRWAKRPGRIPNHAHAFRPTGGFRTDFDNAPAKLAAQPLLEIDAPHRKQHIGEVETGGIDCNADFPGRQGRLRVWRGGDGLERPVGRAFEDPGHGRIREPQPRRPLGNGHQPRDMPLATPVGNVVLRIRSEHLPDQKVGGNRIAGLEIDHPQPKVRCFPDQGLAHSP